MIVTRRAAFAHIVPEIGLPLALFAIEAVAVAAIEQATGYFKALAIPDTPLSLIGAAIGIFVSFRTTAAYARWWEARSLWSGISSASRALARQVLAERDAPGGAGLAECARDVVVAQIAWCHALGEQLRGGDPARTLARLLPPATVARIVPTSNVCAQLSFAIGARLARAVTSEGLDRLAWTRIDRTLSDLIGYQGGCERIAKTPLPLQYDVFPELFIYAYCAVLPLTLAKSLHWLLPVVTVVISFAFLIANRIGKNLEDPFDGDMYDTPVTNVAETTERLLRAQLGDATPVTVAAARDGVLM